MSAIARAVKDSAPEAGPILTSSKVVSVAPERGYWRVEYEPLGTCSVRGLVLATPLPQALELLESGSGREAERRYESSIALGLGLKAPFPTEVPVLYENPTASLTGIYDQGRKGLESGREVLVVHASAEYSRSLWGQDEAAILQAMMKELRVAARGAEIEDILFLHRWRYSKPSSRLTTSGYRAPLPLAFAEEGLTHASIEVAFESGSSAALQVHEALRAR